MNAIAIDKQEVDVHCVSNATTPLTLLYLCKILDTNIELQYFIHDSCRNRKFLVNYIQLNCGDCKLLSEQYQARLNVHMYESKNSNI